MQPPSENKFQSVYDAKRFAELATQMTSELARHLDGMVTGSRTIDENVPLPELVQKIRDDLVEGPKTIGALTEIFLRHARQLHSPHYIGHQVPPPLPAASLFAWMTALCNQGGAVSEMSPFTTSIERALVQLLGEKVGWREGFDGIVTNGGTLANLTAVLAARNHHFPESWETGAPSNAVILASEDSHYSNTRAAGVVGLGTRQVIKVKADSKRRMDPETTRREIHRLRSEGKNPFCLIASVCSTATGSFDPIGELAALAHEEKLWLHADGAHGASVLFSQKHKGLLAGIDGVDSLTWDAHKMMHVPSLCTFLLFKERARSFEAFKQDAPYLFDAADLENRIWEAGQRTFECTRQAMAVPLWGVWSLYGEKIFEDIVDETFAVAQRFYAHLKEQSDFEALHEPQSNILCFRYLPEGINGEDLSQLQKNVRGALVHEGRFYITQTKINGTYAFRVTIINPLTQLSHLEDLLEEIRQLSQRPPGVVV